MRLYLTESGNALNCNLLDHATAPTWSKSVHGLERDG